MSSCRCGGTVVVSWEAMLWAELLLAMLKNLICKLLGTFIEAESIPCN